MNVPAPSPSALQSFIGNHRQPAHSNHPSHLHHLALQIAHNLRFQHHWDNVRIHYGPPSSSDGRPLPRPILSGLPPQRLYVHPDEQIELLQKQKNEGKTGMPDLRREREWVLPSHLREKWSLRRFGEVFDAISASPDPKDGEPLFDGDVDGFRAREGTNEGIEASQDAAPINKWRMSQPKRLLLATLDDDSTVVYYIVHDGIVKPRQN